MMSSNAARCQSGRSSQLIERIVTLSSRRNRSGSLTGASEAPARSCCLAQPSTGFLSASKLEEMVSVEPAELPHRVALACRLRAVGILILRPAAEAVDGSFDGDPDELEVAHDPPSLLRSER